MISFFHRYKETSDENRSWRYMELRCKNRSGNHILENWSAFTAALDLRFFKPQIEAVFILDRITSKMGRIITLWRTDPHSLGELSILILWKIYSMPPLLSFRSSVNHDPSWSWITVLFLESVGDKEREAIFSFQDFVSCLVKNLFITKYVSRQFFCN